MNEGKRNRSYHLIFFLSLTLSIVLLSCSNLLKTSSPRRDGEVRGDVSSTVHIFRDPWGVPHIYADTIGDLLFAQGFVHAQERLFQMDAERRIASGRLSEVLGEKALPIDTLFRTVGLAKIAREIYGKMDEQAKKFVDRYTHGINRFIETAGTYPVEFRLLRYTPDTFAGSDVILSALLKSFGLSQWLDKLAYHAVVTKAGALLFQDLNPYGLDFWEIEIISSSPDKAGHLFPGGLSTILDASLTLPFFPGTGGSNAWVVSASKSAEGIPYLANDPHLPLSAPSVWFENHLICPGLDVYGYSFPGAPFVILGFNENVAWGFTNVMIDDVDFFIEKAKGDGTYVYRGQELPFKKRKEVIRIKGREQQVLEVEESVHGPLLGDILPGFGRDFAFRWTGQDATGDHLKSLYLLNRAKTAADVREALSYFELTAQNVLFATRDGDIGYQLAGRIPLRRKNHPPIPVPGDSGEYDWEGYRSFADNPRIQNPPEGFIASANFPPLSPRRSRIYISSVFEPPARGKMIIETLSKKEKVSLRDHENLQNNTFSQPARDLVPLILDVAGDTVHRGPSQRRAVELLRAWDMNMSSDSSAASILSVFYELLIDRVFSDELGDDGLALFKRTTRVPTVSLDHLLFRFPESLWFDDLRTPEQEDRNRIISETFGNAISYLQKTLGENPDGWKWGKLHRVSMRHPFGEKWYLRKFFTIGPEPVGGDGRTVFKAEFPHGLDFSPIVGPSMRMLVSPAKPDDARVVISTGQSGHFYEKHYSDQTDLWLKGTYRKVDFTRNERKLETYLHMWISPADQS